MANEPTLGEVELIPAILLNVEGDDIPSRPATSDEVVWSAWREQYRRALQLRSVDVPDEMHVALRAVVPNRLLDAVIEYATECAGEAGEFAPYLDGGAVLLVSSDVVAAPTCCVDLHDGVQDWVRLVRDRPSSWEVIWTGHPWIMARVNGENVQFTEQADDPRTGLSLRHA